MPMYKIRLTPRQINIVIYILKADGFTSSKQLSSEFDVSVRTIKSEMEQLRCWLREQGEDLEASRGKGYSILCSDLRKQELRQLLQSTERLNSPMDQPMRMKQMILDLFMSKQAVTAYDFSEKLQVSQNTIFNDILQMAAELPKYNVYVKSSHYGYCLDGKEPAVRGLISDLLFDESTNFDVSSLISQFSSNGRDLSEFRIVFSNDVFKKIYQEVIKLVTENLMVLSDKIENYSILSFVIRLCISIARLQNEKLLSAKAASKCGLDDVENFLFRVYEDFRLEPLEAEFDYVTSKELVAGQVDIPKFTGQVINEVSRLSSVRFDKDSLLFQNLYTHFSLIFSKGYRLADEYNPFVSDIKIRQTEIFDFVRQALSEFMSDFIKIDDAFAGYVTLHFLASVEREKELERDIKVLYVCSTGVGVTSFIQQKVASRIRNIEITGFSSILNVRNFVQQLKPDLIISVFPIDGLELPVIEVNALLTENDIQRIQNQVNLLLRAGMGSIRSPEQKAVRSKELPVELIVKGFSIYSDLKTLFDKKDDLSIELLEGFLVHVLLMVSRVDNGEQYQAFAPASNKVLEEKILAVCQSHDLPINESEVSALIPYYEYYNKTTEKVGL